LRNWLECVNRGRFARLDWNVDFGGAAAVLEAGVFNMLKVFEPA
jgi:hypothetical protein